MFRQRHWIGCGHGALIDPMTQPNSAETATERLNRRIEGARARVEAQAKRVTEAAAISAGNAAKLIADHPLAAIGGAIVIGAIVAQVLPEKLGKGSRKQSHRALNLAAMAAELALAYGKHAREMAVETGHDTSIRLGHASHELAAKATDRFNKLAGELGDRIGKTSTVAHKRGTELADTTADYARDVRTIVSRKLRELAARLDT